MQRSDDLAECVWDVAHLLQLPAKAEHVAGIGMMLQHTTTAKVMYLTSS